MESGKSPGIKLFNHFPYPGWLLVLGACLAFCTVRFTLVTQSLQPEAQARQISNDIAYRWQESDKLLANRSKLQHFFDRKYSAQELAATQHYPFYVFAFTDTQLAFWSTNTIVARHNDSIAGRTILRTNAKGVFVRRSVKVDARHEVVFFIPVYTRYPVTNQFLHSHFEASGNIAPSVKVLPQRPPGQYVFALPSIGNQPIGYLLFAESDIRKWTPDGWFIGIFLIGCLALLSWLQQTVAYAFRGKPATFAVLTILACATLIRVLIYRLGYPFHIGELPFFTPELYASSKYMASLGDLFVYLVLFFWIIVYVIRHTHYRHWRTQHWPAPLGKLLCFILSLPFFWLLYAIAGLMRGLIIDSSISFDVNHFYAINPYTFWGILAIIALVTASTILCYLFNIRCMALSGGVATKHLLLLAGLAAHGLVFGTAHPTETIITGALIWALFILHDIPALAVTSKVNQPQMMVWALVICFLCTGIIHVYNEQKEKTSRLAFVEQKLAPARDNLIEFSFDEVARAITRDRQVKEFLYKPIAANRKALDQYLDNQYFSGYTNKYTVSNYLFDAQFQPLFNTDTTSYGTLAKLKTESSATSSSYLFYKESVLDRHFYLSFIPIYNDTVNNHIGYILLDFSAKTNTAETVYPELLQPTDQQNTGGAREYAYAIYSGGKLISQTNDYPFPVTLPYDTLAPQTYAYDWKAGIQTLSYRIGEKRTVVVVHYHSELLETVTLFSYVFGLQVIIALLLIVYRFYRSYSAGGFTRKKYFRLTLRRRVHLSMLGVVFVSFAIIGYVTITYFTSEYSATNDARLQNALYSAKQSVQGYLAGERAYGGEQAFRNVARSASFRQFIHTLSNAQKTDINIYDNNGELVATSQEEIFDKAIISRKIHPSAFFNLVLEGTSLVIQGEKAGALNYSSAYQPLRDENGTSLGYINVPFFSSKRDLDFQISNIVVTLINLYAFIFLISSLITVFVTRWMTRTFDIIIQQFDKLNLEKNERIDWPYDDEVGKLVVEYNKMVQKVELNAARLAQSERETAWREMARQVAHEIKNPLTPMKLNIQYLQQAARQGHPDIPGLTARVSASIIEQIDNLSYIASEFSNFAKLPEACPEDLEMGSVVRMAAELYTKSPEVTLTITEASTQLMVTIDKSQILRVLTNLLENARQAIPDDRQGTINVSIQQVGEMAEIAIADNGTGIDEEVAQRIFQPYFTTKSSGTGLGLAMTQKIIEFWKGRIWFETEVGSGTTFYISLPLKGQ
ncbi:MAG: sensor histidine kinase [Chitinophagia bacterium]|nr:sensor histidine kinase [Chitinophagia bacterium]